MADHLDPGRVLIRDDSQVGIARNDVRGVHELAIDTPSEGSFAEARADVSCNVVHRYRVVEAALTAIRQSHDRHEKSALQKDGRREWDRTTDHHHVKVVLYH